VADITLRSWAVWTPGLFIDDLHPHPSPDSNGMAAKMASSRSFDYLESLPGTVFYKLYQQPATALAIFRRMLPDLGMLTSRLVRALLRNQQNAL
jgi:hypothetical protein